MNTQFQEFLSQPIRGVSPFDELPIDSSIWRQAHDYHDRHHSLHALAAHRPGIVWGLEVVASKTREKTVVVAPGVAIDGRGRAVVLREPLFFELSRGGQHFWSLCFQTVPDPDGEVTIGGGRQSYGFLDGREVVETPEFPGGDYLELGRLSRSNEGAKVREAANSSDPGKDEINGLYRQLSFPHCAADGAVGEVAYVPADGSLDWKPNRAGLWHLLREASGRGFHLHFSGIYRGGQNVALLYMAGRGAFAPLEAGALSDLQAFLGDGGVLLGEAVDGNEAFARAFGELAKALEIQLGPVESGSPLLSSHSVFPGVPSGASQGKLWADAEMSVLLSTQDYGGAWQGRLQSGGRDAVRDAQDFGLNLLAHATRRKRLKELSSL